MDLRLSTQLQNGDRSEVMLKVKLNEKERRDFDSQSA
jgi:hypothetical protein